MEIRGVDGINRVDNNSKVNKVNKTEKTSDANDIADISSEAKIRADQARGIEAVNKAPDIRQDKINQVKERMASGYYNNEEVIKTVAERLMKVLGNDNEI